MIQDNSTQASLRGSQSGFTLMELLVYIGVSAIVVVIAGQVWLQFTVSSKKTSDKMNSYQYLEQALFYLDEDMSRIGSKANTSGDGMDLMTSVFMDSTSDSSSIEFVDNVRDSIDSLQFLAAVFSDDSAIYLGYDLVSYTVNANKQLVRSAVRVDTSGTPGTATNTVVMDSVSVFDVNFGVYMSEGDSNSTLGFVDSMTSNQLRFVEVSNHSGNGFDSLTSDADPGWTDIWGFNYGDDALGDSSVVNVADSSSGTTRVFDENGEGIVRGKTYRVVFNTKVDQDFYSNFDIAEDSMYVLIRPFGTNWDNTKGVPKYYFYPGIPDTEVEREFTFTADTSIANPGFYILFDLENDLSANVFSLGSVLIEEVNTGQYDFKTTFTGVDSVNQKQNVRSMTLRLKVEHDSSIEGHDNTFTLRKFIQLPNNGVR